MLVGLLVTVVGLLVTVEALCCTGGTTEMQPPQKIKKERATHRIDRDGLSRWRRVCVPMSLSPVVAFVNFPVRASHKIKRTGREVSVRLSAITRPYSRPALHCSAAAVKCAEIR